VVGRAKDVVISGGFNVYPKEVETFIDAIEGVDESAVIGVPHPDFGEAVAAVVTCRDGGVTEEGIIWRLKGEIANYKVAKRVFFVDELPRNALGKVKKKVLRERYQDTFATVGEP
jgi:malonyl-CoA/methylmalonyl-CoA synthetase